MIGKPVTTATETVDEVKTEGEPAQPRQLTPEEQAYLDFVQKHRKRAEMFVKANGHVQLPIVLAEGGYQWVNRATRRKMRRNRK
jgi:hypothetical protein